MPAYPHNQADAREEGIQIHHSFGPARILGKDRVTGMEFVRCLSVTNAEGRFAPTFDNADTLTLDADAVIFAIGQATELEGFAHDVPVERGRFKADPVTFATPTWGGRAGRQTAREKHDEASALRTSARNIGKTVCGKKAGTGCRGRLQRIPALHDLRQQIRRYLYRRLHDLLQLRTALPERRDLCSSLQGTLCQNARPDRTCS